MLKVTTYSGAVYYITETGHVRGGSKHLENGNILSGPPVIGKTLLVEAPERVDIRAMPEPPPGAVAAVQSTPVVTIEEVADELPA